MHSAQPPFATLAARSGVAPGRAGRLPADLLELEAAALRHALRIKQQRRLRVALPPEKLLAALVPALQR